MKRFAILILISLAITACKKDPVEPTGDLLITVEYDGYPEENVEVLLFDSKYASDHNEYLYEQLSDAQGQVFWSELIPGMYYLKADITIPVNFRLTAFDSVEVVADIQKNKLLILQIPEPL